MSKRCCDCPSCKRRFSDGLDVLTTLVDAYERKIYPIEPPEPVEAIKHTMDARDLTNKDLEAILHSRRERVWEIMHYM